MRLIGFVLVFLITLQFCVTQNYDPSLAFQMLRASSAAYCQSSQLEQMQCGDICADLSDDSYDFVLQYTYNISDYESVSYSMFVNPTTNSFVTAFRGTHSLAQLVHEFFESYAVSYTLNNISNAVVNAYFYNNYETYIRENFLTNFQNAAQSYPDYNFYVVGHSLGGALANLAVLDIYFNNLVPKEQVFMFTYGAPRTGDINLATAVVNSVNQLFRITHYKDPIPHVPACIVGLDGECIPWQDHPSENDFIVFNSWHTWPEVFYVAENTSTYIICDQAENLTCSDQYSFIETVASDHLFYLGVNTSCLDNGPILGTTATTFSDETDDDSADEDTAENTDNTTNENDESTNDDTNTNTNSDQELFIDALIN